MVPGVARRGITGPSSILPVMDDPTESPTTEPTAAGGPTPEPMLAPAAEVPLGAAAEAPLDGSLPAGETPEEESDHDLEEPYGPVPYAGGGLPRVVVLVGGVILGLVLALGGVLASGALKPVATTLPISGTSLGSASAAVTIEIWADYQCPYCSAQAHAVEPTIIRDQVATGAARMTFRDFAILGQESIDAAVAARCADAQGRFWSYHDLLYASQQGENQGGFVRASLLGLARFAGLDQVAFGTCLDDPAVAKAVAAETAVGVGYGIKSTPTLRISGPGGSVLLVGVKDVKTVVAAIAQVAKPGASPAAATGPGPADSAPLSAPGASPTP
jgi:protein-disulfide isomerase